MGVVYVGRVGPRRAILLSACCLSLVGASCQGITGDPVSPSAMSSAPSGPATAASPYGGNALPLVEVAGSIPAGGSGIVNVTQTATPGTNNFEFAVNVHGAPPDTDLYFQIRGDVAPATRGDGVCPPGFPIPPTHAGGDAGIIHTTQGGSGSTHIKLPVAEGGALGAFEPGVASDFNYRVVNLAQTFDLRTACIVFIGK